jgi:hypothetical protein
MIVLSKHVDSIRTVSIRTVTWSALVVDAEQGVMQGGRPVADSVVSSGGGTVRGRDSIVTGQTGRDSIVTLAYSVRPSGGGRGIVGGGGGAA